MRSLPPFSVLMPLAPWEPPEILREALNSLMVQSLAPKQVVISCDGPPAGSLMAEIEKLTLSLTLVLGPGEEGVGPALARGVGQCHHDLVVRADADDISLEHRCAIQVNWMVNHPCLLVLGSVISEFVGNPNHLISKRFVPIGSKDITREAQSRNPLNHPSVIFRRHAVLAVGNYRSKPGFEDYDLWLRLLNRYGGSALENIPESLVFVRIGPAHLARRHGYRYAYAEANFFISCANEGLLGWGKVLRALAVRLPLRVLPRPLLSWVMARSARQSQIRC